MINLKKIELYRQARQLTDELAKNETFSFKHLRIWNKAVARQDRREIALTQTEYDTYMGAYVNDNE